MRTINNIIKDVGASFITLKIQAPAIMDEYVFLLRCIFLRLFQRKKKEENTEILVVEISLKWKIKAADTRKCRNYED